MNGARWQDNLDGTFTVIQVDDSFSQLDQYVLGLRSPADVDSMFVIDSIDITGYTPTPVGTTMRRLLTAVDPTALQGHRRDVTADPTGRVRQPGRAATTPGPASTGRGWQGHACHPARGQPNPLS